MTTTKPGNVMKQSRLFLTIGQRPLKVNLSIYKSNHSPPCCTKTKFILEIENKINKCDEVSIVRKYILCINRFAKHSSVSEIVFSMFILNIAF